MLTLVELVMLAACLPICKHGMSRLDLTIPLPHVTYSISLIGSYLSYYTTL